MKKKNKTIIVNDEKETIKFASDLAKNALPHNIYCLKGELGVGKTIIAKSFGKFFNVKEEITSPTFNIVKSYNTLNNNIKKIHHFDLYRIKTLSELSNIGFEDYLYEDNSICIIEWPEIALEILPKNYYLIEIKKIDDNKRKIIYEY